MATETLSKFGVPLGGGTGRGGLLQPKFTNRFRVRVINFGPIAGGVELTQQVESVTRPKTTFPEIEINSYNSRAYVAGKHQWNTINLVLKDDITNSVNRLVSHQNQKQLNHFEQTAFAAGINYKFTTIIETMAGDDDTVFETWTLEGCWITEFDYGDFDYSRGTEFVKIALTVRYDNATQSDGLMPLTPDFTQGTRTG